MICSYNYEAFVGSAIESALAQSWPNIEVIVVDDGSTDDSWSVIASFGPRIQAIHQSNGGQGAAYNTALGASQGDWVIWLDSDDLLDADCITRCVALITPDTNKVAFPMRVIDAQGRATGNVIPYTMHQGDVRPTLRRFGHYGGPPGSGNLYRRSAVERFFPIDVRTWPTCADTVPFVVSAAQGPVAASAQPLGSYRIHKRANKELGLFGNVLESLVQTLLRDDKRRYAATAMVGAELGLSSDSELLPTPTQMRTRIISWRLQHATHPYPQDTRVSLLRRASRSLAAWPGYGLAARLAQLAWAACMLVAPQSLVARLVRMNVSDSLKQMVRRVAD
ncbi:hypothetical protein ASF43_11570 [Pseudorhodoferax sp. Leaf267]|nr:hypothetical protein ASF43_11570 [Pseudorhodoferax sp. Leaf267]